MALKFYNTLTRKKEIFKPINKGVVHIYSCGPTVYDYAHIGNWRAFIFYDLLRRYLKYRGFAVKQVMNLTDVDDKTIRNSQKEGVSLSQFTEKYAKIFFEDMKTLNIEKAEICPKATEHILDMVALIKKLMKNGYAYRGEDGSIYYSVSAFRDYGKLSKLKINELVAGARVKQDEYTKENAQDFALWKAWSEEDGDVFWETEIGKGRPGWHIECSAMSMKYLGETFDIHTGGIDLIFPHHENEIAQSEGATGKKFVNYWIHNDHVLIDGKKMSKSLGNFFTLKDLLDRGHDPKAIRYALISTHYRSKLNITDEVLVAAKNAVERLANFIDALKEIKTEPKAGSENKSLTALAKKTGQEFEKHMDDDLDTNNALASIFEFVKKTNKMIEKGKIGKKNAQSCLELMKKIDTVLGLGILEEKSGFDAEFKSIFFEFLNKLAEDLESKKMADLADKIRVHIAEFEDISKKPSMEKILDLVIEIREDVRKKKIYDLSDKIRADLKGIGIVIEDTEKGVKWKKAW
jgi:cysteinyl-tRNA synthetase